MGDEDPKIFFARISRLETTMRAVGIKKSESDFVQIILRQLPERCNIVKIMTLADPQLTRSRLEYIIRSAYSQRKAHEIAKQWPAVGAPAELPSPHAFVVGRGFRDGGAWEAKANEGTTVWYLAAVACLGSSSSYSNTGLAAMVCFCFCNSSSSNTGFATVACRGSSSSRNGLATVACRSSRNGSNGLAAVGFLISITVAPMLFLSPGRRDSSNRCSNSHGESLRSEVTGRTEVAPYLKLFSAAMAGLFRSGFSRKMWRCRCSFCWRDRSSRRRRQWHLLQQYLRLKR